MKKLMKTNCTFLKIKYLTINDLDYQLLIFHYSLLICQIKNNRNSRECQRH